MIREHLTFIFIGVCGLLSIFSFITNFKSKRKKYALFFMALSSTLLLIVEKLAYAYDGNSEFALIAKTCKFSDFLLFLVIVYSFNQYVIALSLDEWKLTKLPKRLKFVKVLMYLGVFLLIISQFTGLYYTYQNNVYHRSPGFLISYVLPALSICIDLWVIIDYREKVNKKLFIPTVCFVVMPVISAIYRFVFHDAEFIYLSVVAAVSLFYTFSIFDTNKLVDNEVKSLLKEQQMVKDMTSQMALALVGAIDAKDAYTQGHSKRVAEYSFKIAQLAEKTKEECEEIFFIALLHDVGKIGIPKSIINKTGKLTDEEFSTIKKHPKIGKEILKEIKIDPDLCIGALYHHERYDGKGYPEGLKGNEIPEIARIIAVADAYDAMTSKRSYRDSIPQKIVRDELQKGIGTQFDPEFAKIMINLIDADSEYKMRQLEVT